MLAELGDMLAELRSGMFVVCMTSMAAGVLPWESDGIPEISPIIPLVGLNSVAVSCDTVSGAISWEESLSGLLN